MMESKLLQGKMVAIFAGQPRCSGYDMIATVSRMVCVVYKPFSRKEPSSLGPLKNA